MEMTTNGNLALAAVVIAGLAFAWNIVGQFFSFVSRKELASTLAGLEKRTAATLEGMESRWQEKFNLLRADTEKARAESDARYTAQMQRVEDTLVRFHAENKNDRHDLGNKMIETSGALSVQIANLARETAAIGARQEEQREQARRRRRSSES